MHLCTLFDSNYLSRGVAMYESLKRYSKDFHLYILAFDEKCERVLKQLNLEKVTIISLVDFEDEKLLSIKSTRSRVEYCWTCTPSLIKYCIETYNLNMCTYLDADIYFYADPEILISEMGDASVMISPHRYTPCYDQSSTSGIYCVQFVAFRRDEKGMKVLDWWRNACIEWCYAKVENGKFGDQKYLDDWPQRFEGVHIMQHTGGGVAPWNVQQYKLFKIEKDKIYLMEKETKKVFPLIFYHYHNLRFQENNKIDLGSYLLPSWVRKGLYSQYILHLIAIGEKIQEIQKGDYHGIRAQKKNWRKKLLSFLVRVNFLKFIFFYFFNWLLKIFSPNPNKKISIYLMYLVRMLIMYHNVYPIKYFKGE